MNTLKSLTVLLSILAFSFNSTSFADATELQSEMLEVEEAIADSEASKAEAAETANRLVKEKKDAERTRGKANEDLKRAKREEERSRERIALNEKKILEQQDEIEKAKKDMEDAKDLMDKMKLEMDKSQAEIEKSQKETQRYAELKKQALTERDVAAKELKKYETKMADIKRTEKAALKDLTRAEYELRYVREKAKKSFENGNKESKDYVRILDEHRQSLAKVSKKLDEIEVELDVDKAYEEKKERKEVAMVRTRNIASLNTGKFAKITSPACSLRSFPSSDSKVMGSYKQGRKVHVKLHDKSWYTTVFNGEKVFMGAGCFE